MTAAGSSRSPRRRSEPEPLDVHDVRPSAENPVPLRVLCLEDAPTDAELARRTLEGAGLEIDMTLAQDRAAFEALLAAPAYDVILADFALPGFDAHAALAMARAAQPETPFVCVSGVIGEEATVELLKHGADDCVLKDHLARLPLAVQRAIDDRARERALRDSEALHRSIFVASPDAITVADLEGRVLLASPAAAGMFGYGGDAEIVGRHLSEFPAPEDEGRALTDIARVLRGEPWGPSEYLALRADGTRFPVEANGDAIRDEKGHPTGLVVVVRDITERIGTARRLQERERELAALMSGLPGMAFRCANDNAWTMRFVSDGCKELTGYSPEALLHNAELSFFDLMHPNDVAAERSETESAIARGEPWTTTYRITTAGGAVKWVEEHGVALTSRTGETVLEGFVHDVTEQYEAAERLRRASAEWRRTFDAMGDSVSLMDGDGRIVRCNLATTALTGLDIDDVLGRPCYEIFHNAHDYLPGCPQRRSTASGRVETAMIEQDGAWLRVTFDPEIDADGHLTGGVHVVTDVTDLKRTEEELRASVGKLEAITEGVIAALSRSVEARDPYTGGHERRVSAMATAMAERMGLDETSTRCIRIAGMLHDIGKIVVPAEILAKPGRLSGVEFSLIKAHPQAAFDILESIEFSCPVAQTVLQHHERLDGSGYPAGLSGGEILPEARVLAVADVVEAMSNHRPYRAALPLDATLKELEEGAGTRYDAAACEAAISLLRDEGFTFDA